MDPPPNTNGVTFAKGKEGKFFQFVYCLLSLPLPPFSPFVSSARTHVSLVVTLDDVRYLVDVGVRKKGGREGGREREREREREPELELRRAVWHQAVP